MLAKQNFEERILLVIYAVRQGYKVHEMSSIEFMRLSHDSADDLAKYSMQAELFDPIDWERDEVREQK